MDTYFNALNGAQGVYQIVDRMGVCVTLFVGDKRALLVDTGYGLGDLPGYIRTITTLPLTVANSHGHWDHAQGNGQFDEVFLHEADFDLYYNMTATRAARERTLKQAEARGALPENFDAKAYLYAPMDNICPLTQGGFDLGGMSVRAVHLPGHTQGSTVFYASPAQVLLTADNWNPTTWLFFRGSAPLMRYAQNMSALLGLPFKHVLASHMQAFFPRERLERFIMGLTPDTLNTAKPSDIGSRYGGINTRVCHPEPESTLVFDADNL